MLIYRTSLEYLGYTDKWRSAMSSLSDGEKDIILPIIFKNNFSNIEEMNVSDRIYHFTKTIEQKLQIQIQNCSK